MPSSIRANAEGSRPPVVVKLKVSLAPLGLVCFTMLMVPCARIAPGWMLRSGFPSAPFTL